MGKTAEIARIFGDSLHYASITASYEEGLEKQACGEGNSKRSAGQRRWPLDVSST